MKRDASQKPPKGLNPKEVPMFVSFGFDDNGNSGVYGTDNEGGVKWASELFSSKINPGGTPCSASFYLATYFATGEAPNNEPTEQIKVEWSKLTKAGHEVGNHTHSHKSGLEYSEDKWVEEMEKCNRILAKPVPTDLTLNKNSETGASINPESIIGFRTPFLEFNDKTFRAAKRVGFEYDCSMEEGWQEEHDGTNHIWPYTLHKGSPGYTYCHGENIKPVDLWELPCYAMLVPPDDLCEKYNVAPGFRDRKVGIGPDDEPYSAEEGKITGLDYNLVVSFDMDKSEFLATMKYNFDLRYNGNRCPMLFGAHTDFYVPSFDLAPNISPKEMREVVDEFLDYVLSFEDVRVVSNKEVLEWLKNPEPLI